MKNKEQYLQIRHDLIDEILSIVNPKIDKLSEFELEFLIDAIEGYYYEYNRDNTGVNAPGIACYLSSEVNELAKKFMAYKK